MFVYEEYEKNFSEWWSEEASMENMWEMLQENWVFWMKNSSFYAHDVWRRKNGLQKQTCYGLCNLLFCEKIEQIGDERDFWCLSHAYTQT